MTQDKESALAERNLAEGQANTPKGEVPSAPEATVSAAVANFRHGFNTQGRVEVLTAMGEEPREYQRKMESILDDLQPRPGLESELVEEIGETFWSIRRVRRMRNGLALKHIRRLWDEERMSALTEAQESYDLLEPFERLEAVLARRGQKPTAEEIEEFVESRTGDTAEEMDEFILLLQSLNEPMEERERKAALRQARAELRGFMESYGDLAERRSRQVETVDSAENLAALMAPHNQTAVLLQRLEDSHLRRVCQLTNTWRKSGRERSTIRKMTFEPGISMKTNKTQTQCPT
jgi:hypothetical protein